MDAALVDRATEKIAAEWPKFMLHDPAANLLTNCYEELPDFQFVLVDPVSGESAALGNSAPLAYSGQMSGLPDRGWDWAITKAIDDLHTGGNVNLLCALQVVVFRPYKGKGISSLVVRAMKENGRRHGLSEMIAPVRPTLKHIYPLTPIEDYVEEKDDDGYPFDPWLRVHVKLGGRIVKPCHKSMQIAGRVAEWERWTGQSFPSSGKHIVPFALEPVEINLERDLGTYIEPNVWVYHPAYEFAGRVPPF
jgi:GNAT superfamily N-acetyltransferase